MGLRSGARGEVFWVRQDGETWLFSPRMRADMSAALVDTDENWKRRPGNSLRVMPPGDTSSTVPEISSTGAVKWRSLIRITDSRVLLTRFRILSYSISSSVLSLGLFAHSLPVGVVLPGVGRHIGQDGHLVDVGIVFGIYSFEFRMEGFVAGAGQAGIAFGDLDEGISFMEVGVVVISWQPGSCGVGYLIGLG